MKWGNLKLNPCRPVEIFINAIIGSNYYSLKCETPHRIINVRGHLYISLKFSPEKNTRLEWCLFKRTGVGLVF